MYRTVSYNIISKYRAELMGGAILWIFLYHSKVYFPDAFFFDPLRFIVSSGYGGVDIFFFLSGFGLMQSMLTKENTYITFYKKRFLNIFPSYFLATLVVFLIDFIVYKNVSLIKLFYSITTLGFWFKNGMFYWFIPTIIFLYTTYPIFYKYYNKYKFRLIYIITIMSVITCILLTITHHNHFIGPTSRIPIFFIGSHIKYISRNEKILTLSEIILASFALVFSFLTLISLMFLQNYFPIKNYGLAYYPFTIGTLPLCLFISIVLSKLPIINKKGKQSSFFLLFSICGSISLEIYLIHKQIVFKAGGLIAQTLPIIPERFFFITYGNYLEYAFYFIITLLLALLLNKAASYIRMQITQSPANSHKGKCFHR